MLAYIRGSIEASIRRFIGEPKRTIVLQQPLEYVSLTLNFGDKVIE